MNRIARHIALAAVVAFTSALSDAAEPTAVPTETDRATATHSFADVKYWSSIFDDPRRDEWQKPQALVDALQLRPGMTVADLGAGTGYFSRYLSNAVGAQGVVFAVEIEPTLLVHLRERAEAEHADNVVPVLASADNPRLPAAGVDLILIADTYHHLDHRTRYLPLLRRALRPAGRIAVVDWKAGELPQGPPPEHKLARERVVEEMTGAGFALVGEPDLLPYHYVLIFAPR
jgi:predicted methyltransferase